MSGPQMTDAERAELNARLETMVSPPQWDATNEPRTLYWEHRTASGTSELTQLVPHSDDELRAATLFYEAANRVGPFRRRVPAGTPHPRTAEERALVAGVLARRDDDTGYLVYADYLTERGDTFGDYVRRCVQRRREPDREESIEEAEAASAFYEAHVEEWVAPLRALGMQPLLGTQVFDPCIWLGERGVVEMVTIDTPDLFPSNAERLFAAAPFLRTLWFARGQLDAPGVAAAPHLAQIEELQLFSASVTPEDLRSLLASPHLAALRVLNVGYNDLGDDGARALTEWPGCAQLRELNLIGNNIRAAGVDALAACPNFGSLRALSLGCPFGSAETEYAEAVARLLRSPHLAGLTNLVWDGVYWDAWLASALADASCRPALRAIELESGSFGAGAVRDFARGAFPELRTLRLRHFAYEGANELSVLAQAAFATKLEELSLSASRDAAGLAGFLYRARLPKLTRLDLSLCRPCVEWVPALAGAARNLPKLTQLELWGCELGPREIAELATSPLLATVRVLSLQMNPICEEGALALARSEHFGALTALTVSERSVGKKGRAALVARFGDSVSFS